MRRRWQVAMVALTGCTSPNPAFLVGPATGGPDGSTTAAQPDPTASTASTSDPTTAAPTSTDAWTTSGETTGPNTTGPVATDPSTTGLTTDTPATATTDPMSTTDAPGACGDGVVDPGEACDDGPNPPLAPGACRPDCAGTILTKKIFVTAEPTTGNFGEEADAVCGVAAEALGIDGEFKAMLADGVRFAAKQPLDGECSADWPIQRFTAYLNREDQLVWVTGELRLLGVVAGPVPNQPNLPAPLLHPIDPDPLGLWTGLKSTWQTADHCGQWQGDANAVGTVGDASKLEGFLDAAGAQLCAADYHLVCVQT